MTGARFATWRQQGKLVQQLKLRHHKQKVSTLGPRLKGSCRNPSGGKSQGREPVVGETSAARGGRPAGSGRTT